MSSLIKEAFVEGLHRQYQLAFKDSLPSSIRGGGQPFVDSALEGCLSDLSRCSLNGRFPPLPLPREARLYHQLQVKSLPLIMSLL